MAATVAYIDSSAFVKLVAAESGSAQLRRALERWPQRASAALLRTEVVRALRRSGHDAHVAGARALMRSVHLVEVDQSLLDQAAELPPSGLRTLDAIHLAAAMSIGPELGVVFAYDARLREAAEGLGFEVEAPA